MRMLDIMKKTTSRKQTRSPFVQYEHGSTHPQVQITITLPQFHCHISYFKVDSEQHANDARVQCVSVSVYVYYAVFFMCCAVCIGVCVCVCVCVCAAFDWIHVRKELAKKLTGHRLGLRSRTSKTNSGASPTILRLTQSDFKYMIGGKPWRPLRVIL